MANVAKIIYILGYAHAAINVHYLCGILTTINLHFIVKSKAFHVIRVLTNSNGHIQKVVTKTNRPLFLEIYTVTTQYILTYSNFIC